MTMQVCVPGTLTELLFSPVFAPSSGSLVQAASLSQPSSVTANVGDSVKINGSEGNSKRYFGWCQQKVPGSGPVTVIYTYNKRPSGSSNTLTISGVQAEDEAVYFCGGEDSSSGSWNGDTDMLCRRRPWGCAGPGIAVSQPHHLILLPDTSSYLAKSLHEAKALGSSDNPFPSPHSLVQ
uniref:Immunoglobulin domain-containing protein n=1 Tax=Cyanoderma ruficeps TaxID=181631 RepID=A0A8C3X8K7_9PASS